MASEERKVRALRDAQRREENKVCADCTERLPNYIVTDFNIFVCTTCSGVHREFSHRVKSVTLAIFTEDEVRAVRKGGNKISNDLYLAKNDVLRSTIKSETSSAEMRRDYIRKKYQEKKWYISKDDFSKDKQSKEKKEQQPKLQKKSILPVIQPPSKKSLSPPKPPQKNKIASDLLSLSPPFVKSNSPVSLNSPISFIPPPTSSTPQTTRKSDNLVPSAPSNTPNSNPIDFWNVSSPQLPSNVNNTKFEAGKMNHAVSFQSTNNNDIWATFPSDKNGLAPNGNISGSSNLQGEFPFGMMQSFSVNQLSTPAVPSSSSTVVPTFVPKNAPSLQGSGNATAERDDPFAGISKAHNDFLKGEEVIYYKNGLSEPAKIVSIHLDYPNPPFYSIKLLRSGQEKNTDHNHLKKAITAEETVLKPDPFQFADPLGPMKRRNFENMQTQPPSSGNPFDIF